MGTATALGLCLAYGVGLLLSGLTIGPVHIGAFSFSASGLIVASATFAFAYCAPHSWRLGWPVRTWCCLAMVGGLATVYIALRTPVPAAQDISTYVERAQAIAPTHMVSGHVVDEPRLNRGLKGRFRLRAERLQVKDATGNLTFQIPVTGNLYVTAPLLQTTGLHAGAWVTAQGQLYRPQTALNPGGFDFRAHLAGQHTYAGLVADTLRFSAVPGWGLWQIRQRIMQTQVKALGSPLGQLVSAMALGRKAVDLPFDIQDLFSRVGLAHTIAASGFHVSLLLGTVLMLVRTCAGRVQLMVGLGVLGGYVTLTGLQPSVVRAALMGVAALIGLASERKVKPVGALLLAVTLMLLVRPDWIWDIGFQLSVAATFGLIVMVPLLATALDWLPVTLASLIAVPLAATLWTLPLILYHFNVISGPSIALNAVATPVVTVVSLGGIGSSALALVSPAMGALAAGLIKRPVQLLLWLAQTSSQLPGSAIALGQISIWQLVGLYSILAVSLARCRWPQVRRAAPVWGLTFGFLALLLAPIGWRYLRQQQVTVLAAGNELVWVLQDHGHTTLVNSGSEKAAFYTVQPFLRQAGINQIEAAIAPILADDYPAGWQTLLPQTPIRSLYGTGDTVPLATFAGTYHPLQVGHSQSVNGAMVQPLGTENPILRLTAAQQSWLLLPPLPVSLQAHLAKAGSVLQSHVLVWHGDELSDALLAAVQPEVAICYGRALPEFTERALVQAGITPYWTDRDGAIAWSPPSGFHGFRETNHRNGLPLE